MAADLIENMQITAARAKAKLNKVGARGRNDAPSCVFIEAALNTVIKVMECASDISHVNSPR